MTIFPQLIPLRAAQHSPFIGDPETGLVHRIECPACPQMGVRFSDRQAALNQGYTYCTCAMPAVVAPTARIRALLQTTLPDR